MPAPASNPIAELQPEERVQVRSAVHYRRWVADMPTPDTRGLTTGMSDRLQQRALTATDEDLEGALQERAMVAVKLFCVARLLPMRLDRRLIFLIDVGCQRGRAAGARGLRRC